MLESGECQRLDRSTEVKEEEEGRRGEMKKPHGVVEIAGTDLKRWKLIS